VGVRGDEAYTRLVRWYPAAWRERYGEELATLMSDDLEGRRPNLAYRARVAAHGLFERGRRAGVLGRDATPSQRRTAGALVIFGAWWAMVLAGASYAKMSEHFASSVPPALRARPEDAYRVVAGLGLAGLGVVAAGALVAAPAFVRFLRGGGWPRVRAAYVRAALASVVTAFAVAPLSMWAHHLSVAQRNGGDAPYGAAVVAWALAVAVALALWSAAAVRSVRQLSLSDRALRAESALSLALTLVMAGVVAGFATWWSSMAHAAPSFLTGTPVGTGASPVTVHLVVTMALMVAAVAVAGFGAVRVLGATGPRRPAPGARATS
jgi:hypothetical protein